MANTQAVIELSGHQYLVSKDDTFSVDQHLDLEVGKTFTTDQVLLVIEDDKATVGTPLVKGASVTLKVEELGKGKKIDISRFKSKSRYRRRKGHRQPQTKLTVTKISLK